jgi:hypothetical protein
MTPEQKAAFINAQAVSAFAAIVACQAANQERINQGLALAYPEGAIAEIPDEYGLGHNAVIEFFRD